MLRSTLHATSLMYRGMPVTRAFTHRAAAAQDTAVVAATPVGTCLISIVSWLARTNAGIAAPSNDGGRPGRALQSGCALASDLSSCMAHWSVEGDKKIFLSAASRFQTGGRRQQRQGGARSTRRFARPPELEIIANFDSRWSASRCPVRRRVPAAIGRRRLRGRPLDAWPPAGGAAGKALRRRPLTRRQQ